MARRNMHTEHENHERWLVSYADFITLLFAFFTVLYATADKNVQKQKKFEESVRQAFQSVMNTGAGAGAGQFKTFEKEGSPIEPPMDLFKHAETPALELENQIRDQLTGNLTREQVEASGFNVKSDASGVRIQISSTYLFSSASSKIRPEALDIVDKLARLLKKSAKRLVIEGHTDDQAIQNSEFPSNWELSSARATTVVRYLIKRHGVEPKKLVAVGYADQRPVVANKDEKSRSKNRRIEILIPEGNPELDEKEF